MATAVGQIEMTNTSSDNKKKPNTDTKKNAPATPYKKFVHFLEAFCESRYFVGLMGILTIWTLYQTDIRLAGTEKEADTAFLGIVSACFFLFAFEIIAQSLYKSDYFILPKWEPEPGETWSKTWFRRSQIGSFYFWLDIIATLTLIMDIRWILGDAAFQTINGGGQQSAQGASAAKTGSRLGRVIRLVRMVRLTRLAKLYKYATLFMGLSKEEEGEEDGEESKVGAAMSDLTNRRVIVLLLLMLIIIPLLTINDPDISLSLGVQLVHNMSILNQTDPATYEDGLLLAISTVKSQLPVLSIVLNGNTYFRDSSALDRLRDEEVVEYYFSGSGTSTNIIYDQKSESINSALFSIYTTSFIIVLLMGGIYFFSSDVQSLVIVPIEKLVSLVRKISQNPLGVEYKMLGADQGFVDGMETTVLLATITKIGALMRVGFGEAGASVIAKNLQESTSGKLNLLGSGTMIYSIFGFCDVRQFTDTTECLQEEVMLFVNRIAHILHSIVVQCSGAANKNIGDAFLLTWKIADNATKEQKALLADQALLTFCKALIELSRHQEFICNFSLNATTRLLKRFPDYKVRIGSGLHVGWAIEGAIGSNRKIDASYLSPHVSGTEFLESSTKAYGVSLLISEPFYKLLSPAAAKHIRQVDRIRKSEGEEPMGLYTYDSDLSIDWNDPFRHRKKSDAKSRFIAAAKRASSMTAQERATLAAPAGGLATINENSGTLSVTSAQDQRRKSKDHGTNPVDIKSGNRRASTSPSNNFQSVPLEEVDENDAEAVEAAAAVEALEKRKQTPTMTVPKYTEKIWIEDQDLIDLRHKVTDGFRIVWDEGINAYIAGDWAKAKERFDEVNRLVKGKDGPSNNLLEYMGEHGYVAPSWWKGYREEEGGGH